MDEPLANNKSSQQRSWIRRTLYAIIALALVLLLLPLWPWVKAHLFRHRLNHANLDRAAISGGYVPAHGNRLIIPKIGVDSEILESPTLDVLKTHNGVWHDGPARNPTTRGNTVIAGHRFLYRLHASNDFYSLPEVKTGDLVYVVWDHRAYEYQVFATTTVKATQVQIRNDHPAVPFELTLYTCTFTVNNPDRFVVSAKRLLPAP